MIKGSNRAQRHIWLCSAALFALASNAYGQAASPTTTSDEIVVTGTQLRGVVATGSAVVGVSREDIAASGATSTAAILQEVPQVFNIGVSEQSRGDSGGNSNITFNQSINIRGISPFATLTLLDGHRMIQQEARAEIVDPSHIPTNMLSRLEVVADGSSAIYGSEAVTGVANLILRRNLDGLEVSAHYGVSNRDYEEYTGQITFGKKWDSGQFTAGYEYMFHNAFQQKELPFDIRNQTSLGGTDIRTTQCYPGAIQVGTQFYQIPAGGVTPATASSLTPLGTVNTNRCELHQVADALPVQERNSFAFTFDQDITDKLSINAEGYVSTRRFKLFNSPTGASLTVPSTNAYFVSPVGVTVPNCSAAQNTTFGTPTGTRCLTVITNFVGDTGYLNPLTGYESPWEGIIGAKYKLPWDWQAALDLTYGFNSDHNYDRSYFRQDSANTIVNGVTTRFSNLNRALASSNPATALNPFGISPRAVIDNTSAISPFNQLFDTGGHQFHLIENLKFDGPVFELPAGAIRAAVGYEHYKFDWWSNNATGPITAPLYATPQKVDRTRDSEFIEINVPIVGDANGMFLMRELVFNAAHRWDNYSDTGVAKNPKFGLKYSPTKDLQIQASYGRSFRSPSINDIYGASTNFNSNTIPDPTAGGASVPSISLSGGNPGIKPETAKSWSTGFKWDPSWAQGFNVNVNYFNLKIENQIANFLADSAILNREAELAGTGIITRATLAQVQQVLATRTITQGTLPADISTIKIILDGRPLNLGVAQTSGFDVDTSYKFSLEDSALTLGMSGIMFTQYKDKATKGSAWVSHLNDIKFPPRWRARYYAHWENDNWDVRATLNYLNKYNNTLLSPVTKIDTTTTTDLHVGYTMPESMVKNMYVGLDVTNLFDQDPPTVLGNGTGILGASGTSINGGAGYDPTKGYILGRLVALTLTKRF